MFKNWINDRFFSADIRSRLERAQRERGRARRRATARRALPGLDRLEDRTVLSVSLSGTVLSVAGDDLGPTNDSIVLRENPLNTTRTQVLVNSVLQFETSSSALTRVNISGRDDNDTITIGNGNLDLLPYAVSVQGGAGIDRVIVNDQAVGFSDTYTITGTTLTRPLFAGLTYGTVEGLTLNAEAGNNTVNINSTAAGVPLTVNAGNGNDTINVGNGNLNNLDGAVTVNGQAGTDRVNVNDQLNSAADTYTMNVTTLTRPLFAGLTYAGIENFVLNAETGFNVFNILGTPLTMTTTIRQNSGRVNVLGTTGPLTILP